MSPFIYGSHISVVDQDNYNGPSTFKLHVRANFKVSCTLEKRLTVKAINFDRLPTYRPICLKMENRVRREERIPPKSLDSLACQTSPIFFNYFGDGFLDCKIPRVNSKRKNDSNVLFLYVIALFFSLCIWLVL